jgi:hypothetical protein
MKRPSKISFTDALILNAGYIKTLKSLIAATGIDAAAIEFRPSHRLDYLESILPPSWSKGKHET